MLALPAFAASDKPTYLALGDSIPFGMNPLLLPPYRMPPPLPTPNQFVGYPEIVAAASQLSPNQLINAACPGETSASFLNINELDLGCNSQHLQPPLDPIPAFKPYIGLKAPYLNAQMAFAETQLSANNKINLVTLSIGANDVLLVVGQCQGEPTCVQSRLGPALQIYAGNLAQILTRIRAKYKGSLIMVKYYSPLPELNGITSALNDTMTQVAAQLATQRGFAPVRFAEGYLAFQLASALFNHDACRAGLLIRLPPPSPQPCDVHPSPLGRNVLAAAVQLARLQP